MTKLEWKVSYSVAVKQLDQQHERLLQLINSDYAVAEFAADARRRVRRRTPCTSSSRQQSRFGEIGDPLRPQMSEKIYEN